MSLQNHEAVVNFNPDVLNPQQIAEKIDDMGFMAGVADNFGEVIVYVEGMTCQSCVRNIEGNISVKPGVKFIKVSLEENNAKVVYDPLITSPVELRDAIDDMGFDATLIAPIREDSNQQDQVAKPTRAVVKIKVEGMTCQSCVKSIEGHMSDKAGIYSIKVTLEKEEAVVEYDPNLATPEQLRDGIEDMGFDASLYPAGEGSGNALAEEVSSVVIQVEGMTCQSCVKNIEGFIIEKPGIKSITVSLAQKEAAVTFDPKLTSPETIREQIDDMGFDASLPQVDEFEKLALDRSGLQANQNIALKFELCELSVEGMTCKSCVKNIEGHISDKEGVIKINVSLEGKCASVWYDSAILTGADIAEAVDDMGFDTKLLRVDESNIKSYTVGVVGMTCHSCVKKIEGEFKDNQAVFSVSVSLADQNMHILYDPSCITQQQINSIITALGFKAIPPGKLHFI